MKHLELLKKLENSPGGELTKPTKPENHPKNLDFSGSGELTKPTKPPGQLVAITRANVADYRAAYAAARSRAWREAHPDFDAGQAYRDNGVPEVLKKCA